jgi:prepilin-type N-terminal cleavage/methylation domain-containing protein
MVNVARFGAGRDGRQGESERDVASATDAARARTGDDGFSFVEIVATIAVMAILMAPMMGAAQASIRASSNTRAMAQVETVLQNAADRVNRAPKVCDYGVYARAAAQSIGWPGSQAVVAHSRFVPGASPAVAGTWTTDGKACAGSEPDTLLVQKVTITVSSPDGRVRQSVEVVKSDI